MARNFRKIVCDPSKKSDLTLFFLTSKIFFRKLPPLYDVLWLIAPKIQREFSGMRRFSTKAVILALNFEFFPWRCIGTGKLFDLTITEDKSFWLYILKITRITPEEADQIMAFFRRNWKVWYSNKINPISISWQTFMVFINLSDVWLFIILYSSTILI